MQNIGGGRNARRDCLLCMNGEVLAASFPTHTSRQQDIPSCKDNRSITTISDIHKGLATTPTGGYATIPNKLVEFGQDPMYLHFAVERRKRCEARALVVYPKRGRRRSAPWNVNCKNIRPRISLSMGARKGRQTDSP